MNLELSDEQIFLRDAARDAFSRTNTIEAARETLDGSDRPDLWPTAVEAGWSGLLVSEDSGGAGLGLFDAMLVMQEVGPPAGGRRAARAPARIGAARRGGPRVGSDVAAGSRRAAFVGALPPGDLDDSWTVDGASGMSRAPAPSFDGSSVTGEAAWVVDAPGADLFVVIAVQDGSPVAVVVEDASVEEVFRYDPTRRLGHVTFSGAAAVRLDVDESEIVRAWYVGQALLAAESVGSVEACLEMAIAYAKERFTFGRAIGSYQAVKHGLVEVMRRGENAKSLLYYAGWAHENGSDEFAIAASAARSAAGDALDYAARENIAVHGGIGATWEHDAPLFFRRAQLSRRLLGGAGAATTGSRASCSAARPRVPRRPRTRRPPPPPPSTRRRGWIEGGRALLVARPLLVPARFAVAVPAPEVRAAPFARRGARARRGGGVAAGVVRVAPSRPLAGLPRPRRRRERSPSARSAASACRGRRSSSSAAAARSAGRSPRRKMPCRAASA